MTIESSGPLALKVCAGNCQQYGALDLLDHIVERWVVKKGGFTLAPRVPRSLRSLARLRGPRRARQLVLAPATKANVDEALDSLS